ncbi:MAG: DedA family protein [Bdellovibrionaceae bacterium]|nr:DedA family protein [Pseudobdellovibrionaceae bacterium]
MIEQLFQFLLQAWDLLTHFHIYLNNWSTQMGPWIYLVLFLIVFAETGLVVTPFLPGDSLLFAIGALAALPNNTMNYWLLMVILIVAALLGDTANYWIGEKFAGRFFSDKNAKFLNPKHLQKTEDFYKKYGGKTIILARFVPIVRTYAPFVAGMSKMDYKKFMSFNVIGGIVWVILFLTLGFFFGNFPVVQKNFTYLIFGIILISVAPVIFELVRSRLKTTPR